VYSPCNLGYASDELMVFTAETNIEGCTESSRRTMTEEAVLGGHSPRSSGFCVGSWEETSDQWEKASYR
jgi:hypothetical protein